MKTTVRTMIGLAAFLAAVMLAGGCNSSNDVTNPPPGGGSSLTASNATPASGNATLDNPTIVHEANAGGTGLDAVRASQTVGGTAHEISVYYNPGTAAVNSVQHSFNPGALTQCANGVPPNPDCPAGNVSVNTATQTVTYTSLVLGDPFGGANTSTITGTVHW